MTTINIQAAKSQLSRLVEKAAAGEEIIIAKAGKPMARLVPLLPTAPALMAAVAARLATLPRHHADPFDRVLVAQAMADDLELYTVDRQLPAYSPLVRLI